MLRKNLFLNLILALAVSLSGASSWASESVWDDPVVAEIASYENRPTEIEIWKYLKEGASEYSERVYGDDTDDNGNPIPWEPTKHYIDLNRFGFEISTSTRSDKIEMSEETRQFLRDLITGPESQLGTLGIFSETESTIVVGWQADAGRFQVLYNVYLLKKILEVKASDLVIIDSILVEPLGGGDDPGTVSIDD